MRPAYGCDLQSLMFANLDDRLVADVIARIHNSIVTFEPRAQDLAVTADIDAEYIGYLRVTISYRHVDTGATQRLDGWLGIADGSGGRFR
ncbi:GPW/gp25 family protein [Burkholderia ambifaria MEX-5]|uniref:GPW/gp25 family protein n=2 Tax=Burkholderia ambifaria TaxID=152480 RepID=B1T4E9_9BURK|nr:GPW/gp25 family protein [Burkholderia ambifaria MEX-5]